MALKKYIKSVTLHSLSYILQSTKETPYKETNVASKGYSISVLRGKGTRYFHEVYHNSRDKADNAIKWNTDSFSYGLLHYKTQTRLIGEASMHYIHYRKNRKQF